MARELARRTRRAPATTDDYIPDAEEQAEDAAAEEAAAAAPRRSRRSAAAAAEEAPARARGGRRGRVHTEPDEGNDDGGDDDAPRGARRGRGSSEPAPQPSGGWGAVDKAKSEGGDYAENLKVTDEAILVKFLDAEPFAVYKQHWIERTGKKSFNCLAINKGDPCALCDDLGDKPRAQISFNVIDLTDPAQPEIKVWTVGVRVGEQLKGFAKDKKTSPLNRADLYWSVSKSGKGNKTVYSITPVKERDLSEDWDTDPLSDDELAEFEGRKYGTDIVQYQTKKQLREISDEVLGED